MSKRILIVDDEADINIVLREILESNGFTVDSFDNPRYALENFIPHFYDLLILDIKMPEMNGFSFYREIKKLDEKIKVCILTAAKINYREYSDILSSLPDNCIILKPVTNEDLLRIINKVIHCDL
ncbi:MAG TPA: response regulator [Nitrososphaeraceae archaeon]|jgi:two-component SAPR family response regulator